MKMLKSSGLILLVAALTIGAGCTGATRQTLTLGEMVGNTYSNDFFGITYVIPDNWTILTQVEIAELNGLGEDIIRENNEDFANKMDLSKEQTLNLTYAFMYPLTNQNSFNPSFMSMAENLNYFQGLIIKSGSDYLNVLKGNLEEVGLGYEFDVLTKEEIGGISFDVLPTRIQGTYIHQKYYAAIMKKYAVCFIITYSTDIQKLDLDNLLATVQFE